MRLGEILMLLKQSTQNINDLEHFTLQKVLFQNSPFFYPNVNLMSGAWYFISTEMKTFKLNGI